MSIEQAESFESLKACFQAQADPEKAIQMAAYMRDQFEFYGIQSRARRECAKDVLKQAKKTQVSDWNLLDRCWEAPQREFQYFVIDYLAAMQRHIVFSDLPRIEHFLRTKQWWDSIDGLDKIVANIPDQPEAVKALMRRWSKDSDFWLRRVAINHQRQRKAETDTALLAEIIENNLGSDEFFINKAIGWALREYAKTDPEWVSAFLQQHQTELSALSLREASKYLSK